MHTSGDASDISATPHSLTSHCENENENSKSSDKLTNKGDRFNDDRDKGDEANEELQLQLPLLSQDHELTKESGNEVEDEDDEYDYTGNDDDDDDSNGPRASSPAIVLFLKETMKSMLSIFSNQSGSFRNISQGFSIIFLFGTILGIVMPHDEHLPNSWYRLVSSIIGYTYFMSWSVSYYPQIITIYENGSIDGLSTDYTIITALNCICYALYNSFFFWDKRIRQQYQDENGGPDTPITVESNDVAFALHGLLVSTLLTIQVAYYNGFRTSPLSKATIILIIVLALTTGTYILCILLHIQGFRWIHFLKGMATLKILLASTGYIPQLMLNYRRKSTDGFNIWNIYLDFGGGLLSTVQIILDSVDLGDLRGGIMGNWAKLVLGMITLCADSAFLIQHNILYRNDPTSASDTRNDYTLCEDHEVV